MALAVTGVLVVMLGTLINSVGRNTVLLREGGHPLEESVALRRLLHRDIQGMPTEKRMAVTLDGFHFSTSNALLRDHPLDVEVSWIFSDGKIQRKEENPDLKYSRTTVLYTKLTTWGLEFLDQGRKAWVSADISERSGAMTLRLTLVLDGSKPLRLVERVS